MITAFLHQGSPDTDTIINSTRSSSSTCCDNNKEIVPQFFNRAALQDAGDYIV